MTKKIIKRCATVFALVGMVFGFSVSAQTDYETQKVVYYINYDNAKRQSGALRNIQNHINAVGAKNMDVRVVMHGKGLSLLLLPKEAENTKLPIGNATDAMQAKISSLKAQGVVFKVDVNAIKSKKINVSDHLYDVKISDIVPSGITGL